MCIFYLNMWHVRVSREFTKVWSCSFIYVRVVSVSRIIYANWNKTSCVSFTRICKSASCVTFTRIWCNLRFQTHHFYIQFECPMSWHLFLPKKFTFEYLHRPPPTVYAKGDQFIKRKTKSHCRFKIIVWCGYGNMGEPLLLCIGKLIKTKALLRRNPFNIYSNLLWLAMLTPEKLI